MFKYKKILLTIFSIIVLTICSVFILTFYLTGERESFPLVSKHPVLPSEGKQVLSLNNNAVLKILTLNVAHGRKDGANQIFQSSEKIKSNLDDIVSLIRRESPALVGLQEADGSSVWSGDFSHVAYLAKKSGYGYSTRGANVDGMRLSYGTALLSKYPLLKPISVTFKPSPPTLSKGFVAANLNVSNESESKIDLSLNSFTHTR